MPSHSATKYRSLLRTGCRHEAVRREELTDSGIRLRTLVGLEVAVPTARDREQLRFGTCLLQRVEEPYVLRIGNDRIGVSLNAQNRWKICPHVCDGRDALRDGIAIRTRADPLHGVRTDVRTGEHVADIGNAVPVDDGRRF